jgi:hypothetical protein
MREETLRIRLRCKRMVIFKRSKAKRSAPCRGNSRLRHFAPAVWPGPFLAIMLCLGGCQSNGLGEITGSLAGVSDRPAARPDSDMRRRAEELGRQYDRDPDDKATALSYAQALRGATEFAQAAAVLPRLAVKFPRDPEVLGAYGKVLADAGRLHEAAENAAARSYPRAAELVHPLGTRFSCRPARRS